MQTSEALAWIVPIAVGIVGWVAISAEAGVVAAVGAIGAVWLTLHRVP